MKKLKKKKTLLQRIRKYLKKLRPKPKKNYDKVEAVAFVGRYNDGSIGHGLPYAVSEYFAGTPEASQWDRSAKKVYRCKITIEILKNKRGEYVTKHVQPRVHNVAI